jgi:uncharacterized protein (DUF2236 family)
VLALASTLAAPAFACGVCVEDKIAVTYDQAVITQAARSGQLVVFAAVEGAADAKRSSVALKRAASRVHGIDGASVRVATDPAAVSFALDAKARTPEQALKAIEQGAGPLGLHLTMLRVVEPDARTMPR